jgi:hypothetical protein
VGEGNQKRKENDLPMRKIVMASLLLFTAAIYIIPNEERSTGSEMRKLLPFELTTSLILNFILLYFVCTARIRDCVKRKLFIRYPCSLFKSTTIAPESRQES